MVDLVFFAVVVIIVVVIIVVVVVVVNDVVVVLVSSLFVSAAADLSPPHSSIFSPSAFFSKNVHRWREIFMPQILLCQKCGDG